MKNDTNTKGMKLLLAAYKTVMREDRVGAMMKRAIAAAEQGDINAAIEILKAMEDANPMHIDPAVMLGILLLHEKSQQFPAMVYFQKAVVQEPNTLSLWHLACDKLRGGKTIEAISFLNVAAECQPVDSYAILTLAWVLRLLGKLDDARAIINDKLLKSKQMCICPTLELLLDFQEIPLNSDAINLLFGKYARCTINLGCLVRDKGYAEKLLSTILGDPDKVQIAQEMGEQSSNCIHLDNPALDSYKYRYGQQVIKHYARAFLKEILLPEITRIFTRNNMLKTRAKKDHLYADMVAVPAGEYTIGSKKCFVPAFRIDKYPVTNQQWREFRPDHTFSKGLENHPVTNVDFVQATMYARWKGKRLPSEREWEAAARGPEAFRFPWGQTPDPRRANCADNKLRRTTPVTQYPRGASPFGCMDMLGNASEWVDDWDLGKDNSLANRVVKGGGFGLRAADLACWLRSPFPPLTKRPDIGFRCAMDL